MGPYGWNWKKFGGSAAQLRLLKRDLPYLETVMGLTPGREVAVQAGGNLGLYPKRLAQEFRRVITFEPHEGTFANLLKNAPEQNIEAHLGALGADTRPVAISEQRRDGKLGFHEGIVHVCGPGDIQCSTIDGLDLVSCDLICLDTEGSEWGALHGAEQTIRRCRPVLFVEINKNCAYVGVDQDALRHYIVSLGYRFVSRLSSDEAYVPQEWAA